MTMQDKVKILSSMQDYSCVSGFEQDLSDHLASLRPYGLLQDDAGNLYRTFKGSGKTKRSVLLEAHLDEIGLVTASITEEGFLACQTVGGVPDEILPGTEVTVYGKKRLPGMIGSRPPHLSKIKGGNDDKTVYVYAGFSSKEEASEFVKPGDPIHYGAPAKKMNKDYFLSRGLDNKVGVLTLLDSLTRVKTPYHDVTFLLSVGEETTGRGSKIFTNDRIFDCAVVVDAGFGKAEGLDPTHTLTMGDGPSVSITERENIIFARSIIRIARDHDLPCQVIAEPGGTGTNSTHIQIRHGGIPTAVVSIPILNMHTQSEIVHNKDIDLTSELLIALVNEPDLFRQEGR